MFFITSYLGLIFLCTPHCVIFAHIKPDNVVVSHKYIVISLRILLLVWLSLVVVGCNSPDKQHSLDYTALEQTLTSSGQRIDSLTNHDSLIQAIASVNQPMDRLELLYRFSQLYPQNIQVIEQLQHYAKRQDNQLYLGHSYLSLGRYYADQGKGDSSFYNFQKANAYYNQLKDSLLVQQTFSAQAVALYKGQLYTLAQSYVLKSANFETQKSPLNTTFINQFIFGASFIGLKQYDLGIEKLDRALETLGKVDMLHYYSEKELINKKLIVIAHQIKGYIGLKQYQKALAVIAQTCGDYNLNAQGDLALNYADFLQLKCDVHLLFAELSDVEQDLEVARAIYTQAKQEAQVMQCDLTLAQLYIQTNNFASGHQILLQILAHAKQRGDLVMQKNALGILLSSPILDQQQSSMYFLQYQQLSEVIYDKELQKENTFAKISLDTDRLTSSNILLSTQKDRFQSIAFIFGFVAIVAGLAVVLSLLRQKIKKIQMIALFQKDSQLFYDTILNREAELAGARTLERKNIASELHDGVLNKMFVTRFLLQQTSDSTLEQQKPVLLKELVEVEQYLRNLSHTLNKEEDFKMENFHDLLLDLILIQNRSNQTVFSLEVEQDLDLQVLSHKQKVHLYRIMQEALQNVHKHAKASLCLVKFSRLKNNNFHVSIWDNGVGFAVNKTTFGIGLENIKRRAELMNANFSIKSSEKGATLLCLYLLRVDSRPS